MNTLMKWTEWLSAGAVPRDSYTTGKFWFSNLMILAGRNKKNPGWAVYRAVVAPWEEEE